MKYKMFPMLKGFLIKECEGKQRFGGWVESKDNLSQEGDCWIDREAKVYDKAKVRDNAQIQDSSEIYNTSIIENNAVIKHYAKVEGSSIIGGNVIIGSTSIIRDCSLSGNFDIRFACIEGPCDYEIINVEDHRILRYKTSGGLYYFSTKGIRGTNLDRLLFQIKKKSSSKDFKKWEAFATIMKMHYNV